MVKMKKKVRGGTGMGCGGQGGRERRIEVIVKMQKKVGGCPGGLGGQGGCERRIEKMKINHGGRGSGVGRSVWM